MATLEEDLKAYIEADGNIAAKVGNRVFYNHVDKTPPLTPYIYFAQRDDQDEMCLGDAPGTGPFRFFYDFEYIDRDPFRALTGARMLRNRLDKVTGAVGGGTVQLITCENQDAGYESKGIAGNVGLCSEAFVVEAIP